MTALAWGRRFLMCPPEHFGVLYEINPWMHREVAVDLDLARRQWEDLVATLTSAGAVVERMAPHPQLPDLVFTANAGTNNRGRFVAARFRHPERAAEVPHYAAWFGDHGYAVASLPGEVRHEGAGDALPFGDVFLSGYRQRSDAAAGASLSRALGAAVRPIELTDPRFYHLDLTFCPLDDRRALVAPGAWDAYARKVVAALVPEPWELEADEVESFCANSVVVDRTVVMAACPPRLGRRLEAAGFEVAVAPVGEFLKAGGGCRCLTLALDVAVGPATPERSAPPPSTGAAEAR